MKMMFDCRNDGCFSGVWMNLINFESYRLVRCHHTWVCSKSPRCQQNVKRLIREPGDRSKMQRLFQYPLEN